MAKDQIIVNGKPVSKADFEKLQEEMSKTKGMKLVEVSPNNYKTKLFG